MKTAIKGNQLTVTDNDHGEITVTHNGIELRGWSYSNDNERRTKMLCAREYVEGWYDGGLAALDIASEIVKTSL
jgi:hypothetical protein